jgi:hypothetical protein
MNKVLQVIKEKSEYLTKIEEIDYQILDAVKEQVINHLKESKFNQSTITIESYSGGIYAINNERLPNVLSFSQYEVYGISPNIYKKEDFQSFLIKHDIKFEELNDLYKKVNDLICLTRKNVKIGYKIVVQYTKE